MGRGDCPAALVSSTSLHFSQSASLVIRTNCMHCFLALPHKCDSWLFPIYSEGADALEKCSRFSVDCEIIDLCAKCVTVCGLFPKLSRH